MKGVLFAGLVFMVSACSSPTAGDDTQTTPLLVGAWDYSATQSSPMLQMTGSLTITQQDMSTIQGSIEYTEINTAGVIRQRVELFSGRVRSDHSIAIDAAAADGPRRHLGWLMNDSIGGSFERPGNADGPLRGSFSARRR